MAEIPLKVETKVYDGNEGGYGYLYGLNQKIPDEDFEKIKPYMKDFRRNDFKTDIHMSGRPQGWRFTRENVPIIEEILGIEDTLEKHEAKIKENMADPIKKSNMQDKAFDGLKLGFTKAGTRPKMDLSRLAIHSAKIYDPDDDWKNNSEDGYGSLFIYTPHAIWYIVNNSSEGSNKDLNNVSTPQGGAIGYRLMYNSGLDELVRIYSDENEYSGKQLY
ncbi:MAG: hypothetical protein Q4Q19_04425 [Methanobrevibacter sp.]|nr:hypothetical protein [Methanobrevibacter sp.]